MDTYSSNDLCSTFEGNSNFSDGSCIEYLTFQDIAKYLGKEIRSIQHRALSESWEFIEEKVRGGYRRLFHIDNLPSEIQEHHKKATAPIKEKEPKAHNQDFVYNKDQLWSWADKQTQKRRDQGKKRADLLIQCVQLMDQTNVNFITAAQSIAEVNPVTASSLKNWYYGTKNGSTRKIGAKLYEPSDWPVALMTGYKQKGYTSECNAKAWGWLKKYYLCRRKPSFSESYRRLCEVAHSQEWRIPCEKTLRNRMDNDVPEHVKVEKREGLEALNKLYPSQKRDKRCFVAGEAVSGDGLKFDKIWVDWGDDIINTTTGWFWLDIYSNKLLAHRIAKTENTDLFRLATYDLTKICAPTYIQVDNTRVAANKAMTGGTHTRYRFKKIEGEANGTLNKVGMVVHFTSPDHTFSNAGVKPIERAFGIGGIHSEVANSPKLFGRGFSKKTAIPIDEFRMIVAEEVQRWNARPKRRTDICNGILSYDDAFNESFSKSTVRKLSESQRRLFLLMPETVRVTKMGEIKLKAGAMGSIKNTYWNQSLTDLKGMDVEAHYDPENLSADISVYSMDGRFLCQAEHKAGVAFNDTAISREHAKNKKRILKAQKKIAADETRMSNLEMQGFYPELEEPTDIPEPGIVQGNFKQKMKVVDGVMVDTSTGEILNENFRNQPKNEEQEMWTDIFPNSLKRLQKQRKKESLFESDDDE